MWILFVEAGVALFLLVFIVWWTMYSGRKPPPRPLRAPREPAPPPAEQPHQAGAPLEDDTPRL